MTTPRVTVPVEPTEAMIRAGKMASAPAAWHYLSDAYRAMLSAAPAPEGRAASPLVGRLAYGYAIMHQAICHMAGTSGACGRWYYDKANEVFGRVSPIHAITETSNPHVNGDYFSGLSDFLAALATREEAPAEAGELVQDEDFHGSFSMPYSQPQAREDALPVAWRYKARLSDLARSHWHYTDRDPSAAKTITDIQPLYTHPAPDALRVAVEALEKIADARVFDERGEDYRGIAHPYRACRADETEQVAIKALAALQAEQGAK